MSRYTSATDADLPRDARRHRRRLARGAVRPQMPAGVRLGRALDLPAGLPEQDVYAHLRDLAARNTSAEDEITFLGAGMYDHYVPAVIDMLTRALGVPDAVHALPARDLPGRAAGDVRVPDRDQRAHRPAGLQRVGLRGPERRRRGRLPRQARQRQGAASSSRAACTRTRARRCHLRARLRHRGRRGPAARRRDRPGGAGPPPSTTTPAPSSSRSPTSSAPSRTPRRSAAAAQELAAPSSSRRSTRSRSASSSRPASAASTSPSARASRSATAWTSAGRRSASSPRPRRTCAGCRAASPARPSTSTAAAASC